MRPLLLRLLLTGWFCTSFAAAQELAQVSFANGSDLRFLSLLVDGYVQVRISPEGQILEFGTEESSPRNPQFYAPRLLPYAGRVEYYGREADSLSQGKIKSIGTAFIQYYESFETEVRRGRIRSIGSLRFDYYEPFENKALAGKLRTLGTLNLGYYTSFENPAFAGKLRMVGSTQITYYSSFDDRLIRGKVKTIGSQVYEWYTSVDRLNFGGSLKTGAFRQNIANITYIVQ